MDRKHLIIISIALIVLIVIPFLLPLRKTKGPQICRTETTCGEWTCQGDNKVKNCVKKRICNREVESRRTFQKSKYSEWCHYLSIRPDIYLKCEGVVDCDSHSIEKIAKRLKRECENKYSPASLFGIFSTQDYKIPDKCTPEKLVKYNINWIVKNIEPDVDKWGVSQFDCEERVIKASQVLENGEGVCVQRSILLAAIARAQGIPTKVKLGCTGETCNSWNPLCRIPAWWFVDPSHVWNEVWIYKWKYADAGLGRYGEYPKDINYYDIEEPNPYDKCSFTKGLFECRK